MLLATDWSGASLHGCAAKPVAAACGKTGSTNLRAGVAALRKSSAEFHSLRLRLAKTKESC